MRISDWSSDVCSSDLGRNTGWWISMGDDVAKKVLVTVDDCYAQTKALAVFPRMAVEHAVRFSAPTAVKSGHVGLTGMDGEGFGWYVSDGKPFTFNLEGEGERTRYDG